MLNESALTFSTAIGRKLIYNTIKYNTKKAIRNGDKR